MKIAPSILSADFTHLARDIRAVETAGADALHVDIMDGHFVPNLTFGPQLVRAIRPLTQLPLDVHLMVDTPADWVGEFAEAGGDVLLVHVEATDHIYGLIQQIQALGVKAGVVVNPGTPLVAIESILPLVDQVLVMTVNPGFGGQAFLPAMVAKIAALASRREQGGWAFTIEVDGGITDQTIGGALAAGADLFVAGSYVYTAGTPAEQIARLRAVQA